MIHDHHRAFLRMLAGYGNGSVQAPDLSTEERATALELLSAGLIAPVVVDGPTTWKITQKGLREMDSVG